MSAEYSWDHYGGSFSYGGLAVGLLIDVERAVGLKPQTLNRVAEMGVPFMEKDLWSA